MRMKHLMLTLCCLTMLYIVCSGCEGSGSSGENDVVGTVVGDNPEPFYENIGIEVSAIDVGQDTVIIQSSIRTNSERIRITNTTSRTVNVCLFQENNIDESIMNMSLGKDESDSFTNLTSAQRYAIGVSVDDEDYVEVFLRIDK